MNYKIGDIFYLVMPSECDYEYFDIYQGKVCSYNCGLNFTTGEMEVRFYETLILNCPQLQKLLSKDCHENDSDPSIRLEEIGIGEFLPKIQSMLLSINVENDGYMHKTIHSAKKEIAKLYDNKDG